MCACCVTCYSFGVRLTGPLFVFMLPVPRFATFSPVVPVVKVIMFGSIQMPGRLSRRRKKRHFVPPHTIPSNLGAPLDNLDGLRTFADLVPEGPDIIQGPSASTVKVISVRSWTPSPTQDFLDIDQDPPCPKKHSPVPRLSVSVPPSLVDILSPDKSKPPVEIDARGSGHRGC